MVDVIFDLNFKRLFCKIRDGSVKDKIIGQIAKIKDNPDIEKQMKYSRKGTRELYAAPYGLSYYISENSLYIIDLYHKDDQ